MGVWRQLELESLSKNPQNKSNDIKCLVQRKFQTISTAQPTRASSSPAGSLVFWDHCCNTSQQHHSFPVLVWQHPFTPWGQYVIPYTALLPMAAATNAGQLAVAWQPSDSVRRVPIEGDRDSIKNRKGQFNSSQVQHARFKPSFDRHITTVCKSPPNARISRQLPAA